MRQRLGVVLVFLLVSVLVLAVRLAWVQVVWGPELSAKAEEQRARIYVEPARRGAITDRDGREMSYTMQARSLTVSPDLLRKELREQKELELRTEATVPPQESETYLNEQVDATLTEMAQRIPQMMKDSGASTDDVSATDIEKKLRADSHYEVLVRNVDPDVAAQIAETFHGVAADHQDIRQYPNGAVGENILGKVSMDGQGQFGFEASGDALLSGINGRMTEDVSTDGQVIPGTLRDQVPAIDGKDVRLTVDVDVQNYLQQKVDQARAHSGAKDAEAVVLDAHTGEVVAMANTGTIDPNGDIEKQLERGKDFDNPSISAPYEPGSVAKIITAAGVIEEGLTTPDEVLQVPGAISMAGVTVNDAWSHGTVPYTTTGIFGKSSNVGTLMLAQRLGEEKFAQYLEKFGIGQSTGVELPNESAGLLPSPEQWSGGTFANLPIGQGMSWTTLQMASVYQALANGGERVEPRIIKSVTNPDGSQEELPEPKRTRVVRPETARTVVDMFRAVTQSDPTGVQSGTGPGAAIEGYQTSGKTGTAQQVDPNTGAYSMSDFWITFAGVAPADNPRYVIAVMLDDPDRGVEPGGQGGQSAAPVFRDVASWLMDRDNVPTSAPMEGLLTLQAG
ncbi:penicillin-binding protein 2 [Corynebacterium sp. zg-331]|uniref:peptidoglycan D,D-transpeptidase FtsI family protein n=1 Tax=unclassified Corynebacterium TaxID=2624378 RepID=UPI00128BA2BC|nr:MULTISPECIES: penicillin-binding protein 2 [unclassified Corynebacterium]MBC3185217.1 penicillin-binding protein 2 [Corynebacterium sp. zg-331]MPV51715.1 penicillin-binding protein 2 [Corynebacterium sp. zg331]